MTARMLASPGVPVYATGEKCLHIGPTVAVAGRDSQFEGSEGIEDLKNQPEYEVGEPSRIEGVQGLGIEIDPLRQNRRWIAVAESLKHEIKRDHREYSSIDTTAALPALPPRGMRARSGSDSDG